MLAAELAELLHFKLVLSALLFAGSVIPVAALSTLEEDVALLVLHGSGLVQQLIDCHLMPLSRGGRKPEAQTCELPALQLGCYPSTYLGNDLCDNSCANSTATFTDSEAQLLVHRDRGK